MRISYDNWFCCCVDDVNRVELCKIKRNKGGSAGYSIITYYEGKEVYSGTLNKCKEWIETHWIEKRYLEHYGKAD